MRIRKSVSIFFTIILLLLTAVILGQEEEIISETKPLAINIADLKFEGNIIVRPNENNSRLIYFKIDVVYEGKGELSVDEPFGIFYPGIKFTFIGIVCIPAINKHFTAKHNLETKPSFMKGFSHETRKIHYSIFRL